MPESNEVGMRTSEHMSEIKHPLEQGHSAGHGPQPEGPAQDTPQNGTPVTILGPSRLVSLQPDPLPEDGQTATTHSEDTPTAAQRPEIPTPDMAPDAQAAQAPAPSSPPKLDPVTKLSNMIKAQVAAACTAADTNVAEMPPAVETPLLTSVPPAPVFTSTPVGASQPSATAFTDENTHTSRGKSLGVETDKSEGKSEGDAASVASVASADPINTHAEPAATEAARDSAVLSAAVAALATAQTTAQAAAQATEASSASTAAASEASGAPSEGTGKATTPAAGGAFAMPVAPPPKDAPPAAKEPKNSVVPDLPGEEGGGGQPQRPLSLFDPVEILRGGMLPEDLPFANEVDAALARRPLRMERYLSLAVGCGILLFILWAAFASIDEVTHAEGQVISSQRTQAIQNLEGGILRNILVSEGQTVEKGDALAQLDNELAASSYRDAINKAMDNTLAIIRLEAERKGEEPQFPQNVEEWVQEVVGPQNMVTALPQAHQAIKDQMSAYQARTQQKSAELLLLESQYQQRMHEVGELTARKRQLDESLALAVEQRDIAAGLLQKRSTSRVDYLNQQQRVVQLSGEVEALASTIPKAQSAAQETSQRMTFRKAEIDAAVTDELNKRRMDLASINETLAAGGDRVTRTELRSPVRGTVKRIAITTLGGVVKPGESIMEIVPLDDTLLVEAKVRPSDVAFLRPGQRAMVKVSAYDFSIYGGLEGSLEQISADTIEDKRGEFFYLVKVRTNKTAIQHQDKSLPIIPGMMATVDILIGKKTVLDYLLKPILKARDRALRER